MNGIAVLAAMIVIYGCYAAFDPRIGIGAGRRAYLSVWLAGSAAALGWAIYEGGIESGSVATLMAVYLVYGVVMTFVLEKARVVILSMPLLLVVHGMGLADVDLLVPALVLTAPVLWVALHEEARKSARVVLYLWCMVVLTVYTARFVEEGLVDSDDLSTLLLVLPFLLVRLSSFVAMLTHLMPDRSGLIEGYRVGFAMISDYAQFQRAPIALALTLAPAACAIMVFAADLDQEGLAFVVLYGIGHAIGMRLDAPQPPRRTWWDRL